MTARWLTRSLDGATILTGCENGDVFVWSAPDSPFQGQAREAILWTQVSLGMEVDEHGKIYPLDLQTWTERRQELKQQTKSL